MEKLKNIINLSKIFIFENNNFFNIIDKENNKINKKSIFFWLILILFVCIFYLSYEIISYLKKYGIEDTFIYLYFFIIEIVLIIQTIMIATNLFYFSKDTENILPLPFKPLEIMIAKFNAIIFMLYGTELIIGVTPFIIYGMIANMGILFFINLIFVLIIFPIFIVLFFSIIIMFLSKTVKFFKNKDVMQIVISSLLIILLMGGVALLLKDNFLDENSTNFDLEQEEVLNYNFYEKIIKINDYFLTINPSINILLENNILKIIFYYLELISINIVAFFIFLFLGHKFYLKQLLRNSFYIKEKNYKKINLYKKCKKRKILNTYIKKELKLLYRNPVLLVESIFPVLIITIITIILFFNLAPRIIELFNASEEEIVFDFEAVCMILGLMQIIGLFNYISITAFSREGHNARIMKSLPINLYKQFIYKNIPQITLNIISNISILGIIFYEIPDIGFKYILIMFILNILLTVINSFILCLIDLINPKINWNAEYELIKNKNKLLQYVLIAINVLFLLYFYKVLEDYNLNIVLGIFGFILLFIFIIINLLINKYKNKLFEKIN